VSAISESADYFLLVKVLFSQKRESSGVPHIINSAGVLVKKTIRFFNVFYSFFALFKAWKRVGWFVEVWFFLWYGLGLQFMSKIKVCVGLQTH